MQLADVTLLLPASLAFVLADQRMNWTGWCGPALVLFTASTLEFLPAPVPMCCHCTGEVNEVHEPAAKQTVERVGVIREHHFGHLGNRFRNRPRLLVAVETFHT